MAALFSKNFCFNCKIAINSFKNGWQLRSGQLAKLCDLCAFFYEDGRFCLTFHSSEDGWRECESCQKLIHCGCGVSRYDYELSDFGGIVCINCTKQNLNIVRQETGIPLVGDNENITPAHGNCGNSIDESAGTGKDLQQISKKAESVVTPLFEKLISDSDADPKLARFVIPRRCAEKFFPVITEPNGIPIQVQDSNGNDWVFTYRHWPNANSKMFVIDGIKDLFQSLQWRAGDKMKFSRVEPDGKFIIEVIRAIVGSSVTFGAA